MEQGTSQQYNVCKKEKKRQALADRIRLQNVCASVCERGRAGGTENLR